MAHIVIKNVGPIKEVDIELNKVNVFIGRQSSGKSTIAKIISFCTWMEKDAVINGRINHINAEYIGKQLKTFHNIHSYFNDGFYIKYTGEALEFEYSIEGVNAMFTELYKTYKVCKISYIPSERNLSAFLGIESLMLSNSNIRSFIFDWLRVVKNYTNNNSLDILSLGLKYYNKDDNNIVELDNGKEINISEASSGLQSLIPICVFVDYLLHWIYENEIEISFERSEKIQNTIDDELRDEGVSSALQLKENISKSHYTSLIIEEPEQNLFPETQKDLIYFLIKNIIGERDHRLCITTHSPYILYALNNCMMAGLVDNKMPESEQKEVDCWESRIKPEKCSIWEIKNGELIGLEGEKNSTIQQEDGLIGDNYFDRDMKSVMDDFYLMLNYYGDDKD